MPSVVETAGRTGNSEDGSHDDDTGCGSFSSYRGDSDDGSFGADTGLESFARDHTDCDVSLEDYTALESFAYDHDNPLLGFLNRNPDF